MFLVTKMVFYNFHFKCSQKIEAEHHAFGTEVVHVATSKIVYNYFCFELEGREISEVSTDTMELIYFCKTERS